MKPTYTISILAWNKLEVTVPCIESVFRHSANFELILTDNGSTDGTTEYFDDLSKKHPETVTVVHNKKNLGFQIPHSHALFLSKGEFFVLLNNDTEVCSGWLRALKKAFDDNPRAALAGPWERCRSIAPDFHGYPGKHFEYVEGSCLMCKSEIVKKHGLFSPYLEFAYGEDSDLSLRMREQGYTIHQVPIRIRHMRGATSKHVTGLAEIQARNHAALMKRWAHYLKVRKMKYPIVVRRTAAIGDVLLTTPVIAALHEQHPLSEIYVQTDFPQLFDRNGSVLKAAKAISPMKDQLVIQLDMAYENMPGVPIIESYANVANVSLKDRTLIYTCDQRSIAWAAEKLADSSKPKCSMHVGPTTWPGKNWPQDRFAAISSWLMEKGWEVYLIGSGQAGGIPCTKDFRHQTTIDESAAILSSSQLFVGLDSFPLHLAMSQGVPSVAVFGATLPDLILSDGIAIGVHADPKIYPCIGERHRRTGKTFVSCDGACMRAVGVDQVKEAIGAMIGS